MKLIFRYKAFLLILLAFAIGFIQPSMAEAAEKKDKASRRAALMMQKMKQDMEAEKANMQAQFDEQKKDLEDKLKAKDEELAIVNKKLVSAERKNKALGNEIKKVTLEKEALGAKQQLTQKNLEDLEVQYQQAKADLKFNDNQRKTLSTNLAQTTKAVNECEEKNIQLHRLGTELVQIYDKPSSYEAAMRNEQFFQLKRVELENILQGKQDKLNDAKFSNRKPAY